MAPPEPELRPGETAQSLTRIQKGMVKSMSRAVSGPALSQVTREIDVGSILTDRADREPGHSVNTYVMAAVASVLGDHPLLNGRLEDGAVIVPDRVNLGMAVAVDDGLVVPVIHGADRLTFSQLDIAIAAAAEKARAGKLRFEDIEGGTFTVSNLGMFGVDGGFALPLAPQAAILLVGRARPMLVPGPEGAPEAHTRAWFGLTYDHRFVDGATAARLLADLDTALADAPALRGGE